MHYYFHLTTKKTEDQRIHEPLLKSQSWWAAEKIWTQASLNADTMLSVIWCSGLGQERESLQGGLDSVLPESDDFPSVKGAMRS